LSIFFRYPLFGAVKKRLAVSVGEQAALSIYKQLLFHTIGVAKSTGYPVTYVVDYALNTDKDLMLDSRNIILQEGDNIGQKMSSALTQLGIKYHKVVLIGADIPHISKSIIDEAFVLLDHVDYVFGPSFDGGFYLIATKSWNPLIFCGVPWSSNQTLNILLKNLETKFLSYALIKHLMDIDTYEDWVSCDMLKDL
jgi:uncharacterized protein